MAQYAFYFDQSRCYSCNACSIACKDWNLQGPGPEKWMTVYEYESGSFGDVRIHNLAFSCGHCENPVCLSACPNNAIFKEEKYGAVLVDQDKCKGSRRCAVACPYGATKFASDAPGTKMSKCNMCIDRLENGDLPACVLACPLRALDFGPLDEMIAKYGDCRQLQGMPAPTTKPAYIVKENDPKRQIVPYDKDKAIELMADRLERGRVFEDVEDVKNAPSDSISRSIHKFNMRHTTVDALMKASKNDNG